MVSQTGMYPALNEGIIAVLKEATTSLAVAVSENHIAKHTTVVIEQLPKVLDFATWCMHDRGEIRCCRESRQRCMLR